MSSLDLCVRIDAAARQAAVGGRHLPLSPIEFRLLALLAQHAGTVLTCEQILKGMYGMAWVRSVHSARAHIARLRAHLGDDAKDPRYITSVHGVGYRLESDMVASSADPLAAYEVTVVGGRLTLPCPHGGCTEDLLATEAARGGLNQMRELAAWHELDHWAEAS